MAGRRNFELVSNECDTEGKVILSEEKIMEVLESHDSIKKWAYIMHDKDSYTVEEEKKNPEHKAGSPKKRHWHVVIYAPNQIKVEKLAEWFGVPANMIDIPRGQNAFLDKVQYLTHESEREQRKGKYRYPDEAVQANFDWRGELDQREANRLKYGRDLSPRDRMRYEVTYLGKTLRQCRNEDKLLYMDDMEKLKRCRMEYISNQEPPLARYNFYVCGRGGIGKGLLCRALARSLCPQYDNDEDIYFCVGARGAAFEGYDGQPVIIWDDRRAYDLLMELNGRDNVYNIFDTFPIKHRQNIKYGSINLCNTINIVNSVEPYIDFLDGLSGEYIDRDGNRRLSEEGKKGQSYRRFPAIIPIEEESFSLLINRGYAENTDNYLEYMEYARIRGNMQRIAEACGGNKKLRHDLEAKTVKPIVDKYNTMMEQVARSDVDEETVRKTLSDYGKIIKDKETVPDGFNATDEKTPFD